MSTHSQKLTSAHTHTNTHTHTRTRTCTEQVQRMRRQQTKQAPPHKRCSKANTRTPSFYTHTIMTYRAVAAYKEAADQAGVLQMLLKSKHTHTILLHTYDNDVGRWQRTRRQQTRQGCYECLCLMRKGRRRGRSRNVSQDWLESLVGALKNMWCR
jgi:hypothetical protein